MGRTRRLDVVRPGRTCRRQEGMSPPVRALVMLASIDRQWESGGNGRLSLPIRDRDLVVMAMNAACRRAAATSGVGRLERARMRSRTCRAVRLGGPANE